MDKAVDHTKWPGKGHRWSGWPGAYCFDCGAVQAAEMAMADDLFDFVWPDDPEADQPSGIEWKCQKTKAYYEALDNVCLAKLSEEERLSARQKLDELKVAAGL